jgi:hypothetical protein
MSASTPDISPSTSRGTRTMASAVELAGEIHDRLLKLVAPATPGSIDASSLSPKRNGVLFAIFASAVVAFVLFVLPVIVSSFAKGFFSDDFRDLLQIIGGAGLGSSFYALHTASGYIKSGTFDPKYNNTYLIRFGLGILSGLILAYFLKDFLKINTKTGDGPGLANIGVSALALLGGYAAQAVAQILDRVSDTLVALVSGSDKDKIDAAKEKAAIDADKKTTQALSDTVKKLQDAVKDPTDPSAMLRGVQSAVTDILQRK